MLNATTWTGNALRVRNGACQRCGRTKSFTRVPQHLQGGDSDSGYRWMCADCLVDLVQGSMPVSVQPTASRDAHGTHLVA